jgi:hypothetical protein
MRLAASSAPVAVKLKAVDAAYTVKIFAVCTGEEHENLGSGIHKRIK